MENTVYIFEHLNNTITTTRSMVEEGINKINITSLIMQRCFTGQGEVELKEDGVERGGQEGLKNLEKELLRARALSESA